MHLSDRELLELHAGALFTHAARGRIRAVNEPDGARAPRFFFARSREGNLWRCRDDVDEGTARELERLAAAEPIRAGLRVQPRHQDRFLAALRAEAGTAVSP